MNPRTSICEVLLIIGRVRDTMAKDELICIGPSNSTDVRFKKKSPRVETSVTFVLESEGSVFVVDL